MTTLCDQPKTADRIIDVVAEYYSVDRSQLTGSDRHATINRIRQMCMWLIRHQGRMSYSEIGVVLGLRDHATIMHGVKRADQRIKDDFTTARQAAKLLANLNELFFEPVPADSEREMR